MAEMEFVVYESLEHQISYCKHEAAKVPIFCVNKNLEVEESQKHSFLLFLET